jgi:hypothetical protein
MAKPTWHYFGGKIQLVHTGKKKKKEKKENKGKKKALIESS